MSYIKKMDPLGRIVIPRDVRKKLSLESGDEIEIEYKKDQLIISLCKKHVCKHCGGHCDQKFLYCPHCGKAIKHS